MMYERNTVHKYGAHFSKKALKNLGKGIEIRCVRMSGEYRSVGFFAHPIYHSGT